MITAEELSRLPLFAKLGPQEVVPDIHAAPGEYLVHEGDGRALWITARGFVQPRGEPNGRGYLGGPGNPAPALISMQTSNST